MNLHPCYCISFGCFGNDSKVLHIASIHVNSVVRYRVPAAIGNFRAHPVLWSMPWLVHAFSLENVCSADLFNGRVMFASDFPLLHCMQLLASDHAFSGVDSPSVKF